VHATSPRAFAAILDHARWRTVGVAVAAGIAGSALIVIPAMAQTGNQPPVANDDTYAIVQNTATPLAVLTNDTDPESDTLTIQSVTTPTHGSVALVGGTLTYTPTAGYLGSDTLTYTVSDGHGNTDTGSVTLVVSATVGVPVAQDDTYTVPMNTATSLTVLGNDSDPNGDTLTITAVSAPAHGTAVIVTGTSITYTPTAGYSGADTFSYTVSDGAGSSDIATVTINVTTTGNAPVVQNDSINLLVGTSTVINVLANDSDPNGDTLTITSVTTPAHGAATIAGDAKSITYAPTAAYTGTDTFTYTVSDGHGNSASGTVAITVVAQNTLLAVNDTASTQVDTAKTISVLGNDVASNVANTLTVSAVTTPGHGTATITGDAKQIVYTPTGGYTGTDTFAYTVAEANGGTATAMVTVTITPASTGDDEDDDDHGKEDCKDGRWFHLGFRNQGLCIADANHGSSHGTPGAGHHDSDDDDDHAREEHQSSRGHSDQSGKSGLGAKIRASVQAALDRGNSGHGNDDHDSGRGKGRGH